MTRKIEYGEFGYKDIQSILTDYRNFSSDIQQEQEIQKSRELIFVKIILSFFL
jgi:hypothetical protein